MTLAVDDSGGTARTISNDVTHLDWTMPSNVQDVTGVDKSAIERILLLADFTLTLNGVFNDAANLSFAVFKNYRTILAGQTGRTVTITHSAQILANEVLFSDFAHSRPQSGELTWSAPGSLSDGTVPVWTT
jgi:hypothetical protein